MSAIRPERRAPRPERRAPPAPTCESAHSSHECSPLVGVAPGGEIDSQFFPPRQRDPTGSPARRRHHQHFPCRGEGCRSEFQANDEHPVSQFHGGNRTGGGCLGGWSGWSGWSGCSGQSRGDGGGNQRGKIGCRSGEGCRSQGGAESFGCHGTPRCDSVRAGCRRRSGWALAIGVPIASRSMTH